MPGTISILKTFNLGANQARGMAFDGGPDIWLAVNNNAIVPPPGGLLQVVKATGAIVATHEAGAIFATQALYDSVADQFWTSPGGAAGFNQVSRYNGGGTLIDNPTCGGLDPFGQIIVNGHYWVGNQGSSNVTELDAATGASLIAALATAANPTDVTGVIVYDGAGSLWVPAPPATLIEIDEGAGTVTHTFDFTLQGVAQFGGLCFQGGCLWATDLTNLNLVKMNLTGSVVATFPLTGALGDAGGIVFDGTWFWVLDFGGGLSVYATDGSFQNNIAIGGPDANNVAHDPADGPGLVWVTSGAGAPSNMAQQFQFTPAMAAGGEVHGTLTSFWNAGQIGGGTI